MRFRDVVAADVQSLKDGDVDGAVAMVRSASLRELRDEKFLAEEFLLILGLNAEALAEFPEGLYPWCGHGIRSWQYPIQFSAYLTYLSTKKIGSYLEIGCRHGGTFIIVVEYLRRFMDLNTAVAIDILRTDIMTAYSERTAGVEYRIANSREPYAMSFIGSRRWDLALIDGDHTYEGCASDYQAVKDNAKMIALHDIVNGVVPGVGKVWREIRAAIPSSRIFEAVDQYRESYLRTQNNTFLGIGVADFS